ncbi:segregation and condensation protein B [Desulfohalotomaculum tongense]|uniref:SMC-Scp complex subunit ScpB n=1 Tax=Desulforadius tongensis TaxID=1216062 RepID=UPI00195A5BC5|nr:SMC-Scp complex subunit ScpB [Desulforadius tongensis]MBM7854681.1 segregation and condensation protein B [Desulforadius tongensis]
MTVLFRDHAKSVIEVLLFVTPEPISLASICRIAELEEEDALQLLSELQQEYRRSSRGLQVVEMAGGWQLTTKPEFASYVERLYKKQSSTTLSRAALETLAIIAYRQPVTRAELEMIRGVKSDSSLNTLLERGLVEEKGRREAPGKPVLYGTTSVFLAHFGLKDISELPDLDSFIQEAEQLETL